MKKAAIPTSQSSSHRAFALAPSPAKVLPSVTCVHPTVVFSVSAVPKPQPEQLDRPQVPSSEPSMAASSEQNPVAMSLAEAVACNNIDVVKALIKEGVDLRPTHWYDTPVLVSAAAQGFVEIVQLLIAARANVNSGYESLPLISAAEQGHLNIVRLLLAAGAYLNTQDASGCTALMVAAATGQLAVVRFLVASGAQFTATNVGETALSLAEKGGHQSVYAFLHSKMMSAGVLQQYVMVESLSGRTASSPALAPLSAMDEMIASGVQELNELLSSTCGWH